ncbi:MAG: hypothetical protein GDA48_05980 [Hormoscilla sp. GM102CHS1]|nr:hypothetical protein [Hormoscilla sp. GM102CHS1]
MKDVNIIIFPDWSAPEESLGEELAGVLGTVITHPDKSQMTLLVDTSNISDEDADAAISSVVMNLLMSEDLDVEDGPEITLMGQLSDMQWELLLPRIHSRIGLENENKEAIARVKATNLPCCELDDLPVNPVMENYRRFILSAPSCFQEIGEAEKYYQYVARYINELHSNIINNIESKLWQEVATKFTKEANFIPVYFNSANLNKIYRKRAEIIEFYAKKYGSETNYEFPERSPTRKKIRLGILALQFGVQTETFATLPVYNHLSRDLFEIILYTLKTSNHRLERYCVGHADALIKLPSDLQGQVQTIREAELDILFISTNVTAVTHPVTLLALHRLARIQIVDANSPVTTGMRHVDYYISSKLSEPENDAREHYTETLIKLDSPPQCFDFTTEAQLLATTSISRESLGIGENTIVYISGANIYKILPEVEAAWVKIIANVPNSVLLLYPFNPN